MVGERTHDGTCRARPASVECDASAAKVAIAAEAAAADAACSSERGGLVQTHGGHTGRRPGSSRGERPWWLQGGHLERSRCPLCCSAWTGPGAWRRSCVSSMATPENTFRTQLAKTKAFHDLARSSRVSLRLRAAVKIKKSKDVVKSGALQQVPVLCVKDLEKADKLKQSLPPGLTVEPVSGSPKDGSGVHYVSWFSHFSNIYAASLPSPVPSRTQLRRSPDSSCSLVMRNSDVQRFVRWLDPDPWHVSHFSAVVCGRVACASGSPWPTYT